MVTTMTSDVHEGELTGTGSIARLRRPSSISSWTVRVAGTGLAVGAATLATVHLLLPLAVRAAVRVLTLTMDGCLWLAAAMSAGTDPWTIVSAVGRAAGETLATREASGVLLALALVGALAFYWLQRLIGSDEQSSR